MIARAGLTRLVCLFIATPLLGASAQDIQKSDDLLLGPLNFTEEVQGIPVNIVSLAHLSMHTTSTGLSMKIRVEADLSDLQAKIGSIIDTIKLPTDNCGSYKPDNPVVTIWGKELQANGDTATLWIHGHVDIWSCLENPVPNTKVEWRVRRIGLGIKTKVPVLVSWPGSPIKNKSATQPFDISEPVQFVRVSDNTIALRLGDPNVHLGGQFVFVTNGILKIAGIDLNDKARTALSKAIDPAKLELSIPPEILKLNPKIESASFSGLGGKLGAIIEMTADIPAEQLNEVLQELTDNMKPKP